MHPHAALVLQGFGGDALGFRARQLLGDMVMAADLTLTMTRRHRCEVLSVDPRALARTFLLREAAGLLALLGDDLEIPGDELAVKGRALVRRMALARNRRVSNVADDIRDPIGQPIDIHEEVGEAIADALIPVLARFAELSPRHP